MNPRQCTEASECKSCKALILWVIWPSSGKAMPVDAGPGSTNNHTVVITLRKSENKLIAEKFDQRIHEGRRRFVSHFVTCPTALFNSPPIEAYPDLKAGEEVLAATPNATHACPKCWTEIEAFARAEKKSEAA